MRHVTGTGFHIRLSLVHTGVSARSGVVSRKGEVRLLLSARMHVLLDAVLALVQRLFRRRCLEARLVGRVAVRAGGRCRGVLLMRECRQASVCVIPGWLFEPVVVDVSD